LMGTALEPPAGLWEALQRHFTPAVLELRAQQGLYWLERGLEERLLARFFSEPGRAESWSRVKDAVKRGQMSPEEALESL